VFYFFFYFFFLKRKMKPTASMFVKDSTSSSVQVVNSPDGEKVVMIGTRDGNAKDDRAAGLDVGFGNREEHMLTLSKMSPEEQAQHQQELLAKLEAYVEWYKTTLETDIALLQARSQREKD
jgi:hypothetical protein